MCLRSGTIYSFNQHTNSTIHYHQHAINMEDNRFHRLCNCPQYRSCKGRHKVHTGPKLEYSFSDKMNILDFKSISYIPPSPYRLHKYPQYLQLQSKLLHIQDCTWNMKQWSYRSGNLVANKQYIKFLQSQVQVLCQIYQHIGYNSC